MTDAPLHRSAAMQGGGFYNRNSALQAANLGSALPLFTEAAQTVPLGSDEAIVIADYGASQGRNSMIPMASAIDALRARTAASRPIAIYHVDLPSNDFASLFTLLDEGENSYLAGRQSVFPAAIGRSHFAPVLPPQSVHLGWSSNTLHWMSTGPAEVPDHGWAIFSASADIRAAVDRQLDADWTSFLLAREAELRPGGRMICQFMARGPETHGFEWMSNACWQSWTAAAETGLLTERELARATVSASGRSLAQIEAPFLDGRVTRLELADLAIVEAPDPFWDAFQEDGDARKLGRGWANLMRAANGPSFALGLDPARDADAVLDAVTARLADHVAANPQRSRSWNAIVSITAKN